MSGLADLLFASDRPADSATVHFGATSVSRGQLVEQAETVAAVVRGLGVEHGCAVGVMLPNRPDLVAALFGVWRAGGVYVPMNPRLTDTEVHRILDTVSPAAIVTDDVNRRRFERLPVAVVRGPEVIAAARTSGTGAAAQTYPDDVALVQFTSGTTGAPKAVLLEHTGVLALMDGVLAKLRGGPAKGGDGAGPPKEPMPNLIPVSLSLWAGIYQVLFAFRVGAAVIIMDGFDPIEFTELVRRFGIRSTVLPPAAMTMLTDDRRVTTLEPLRYVRSISSPLSPLQARRFKERFDISVLNSYGQTEIGGEIVGWSAADSRAFGATKVGSVGRPHEGVEVRALDAGGQPVVGDGSGELWVRTPALSAGYADGQDLGDRLSPDGWFRTGDVGRVDADGFVWIEGRVSDMINRGGLKVHPGEVEEVLRLAPVVTDVAVVGVPDDRLGEVPWAFVVLTEGSPVAPGELAELCRAHLAPYKVPVRFEPLDGLPRNEVGKVLNRSLVELARSLTVPGGTGEVRRR